MVVCFIDFSAGKTQLSSLIGSFWPFNDQKPVIMLYGHLHHR
jgi:hypothetical protein